MGQEGPGAVETMSILLHPIKPHVDNVWVIPAQTQLFHHPNNAAFHRPGGASKRVLQMDAVRETSGIVLGTVGEREMTPTSSYSDRFMKRVWRPAPFLTAFPLRSFKSVLRGSHMSTGGRNAVENWYSSQWLTMVDDGQHPHSLE